MEVTILRLTFLTLTAMVVVACAVRCSSRCVRDSSGDRNMPPKTIQEALEDKTDEWMSLPGVVGTAIGLFQHQPCIKVYVVERTRELTTKIPSTVEGYRVVLEAPGDIRARNTRE